MLIANSAFMIDGAITTGAVWFAAFASLPERRAAVACAALLSVVWLSTVLSYTPYGIPAMLPASMAEYGFTWNGKAEALPGGLSVDTWAVADMFAALTIMVLANRFWWKWPLYGLLMAGCVCHALYWFRCVNWDMYQRSLDVTFLAEEALFYAIGGSGCADWISSHFGACRSLFRDRGAVARAEALSPSV